MNIHVEKWFQKRLTQNFYEYTYVPHRNLSMDYESKRIHRQRVKRQSSSPVRDFSQELGITNVMICWRFLISNIRKKNV